MVAMCVAACGGDDRAAHAALVVSFPGAVDGVVPFKPGGPVEVEVRAEMPGLCTATHATVEVVTPTANPPTATATLNPVDGCTLAGRTTLFWPDAGDIIVRAKLGADTALGAVTIVVPTIGIAVSAPARDGTELVYDVCVATTSAAGDVKLALTGAALPIGTAATLALRDGDCGFSDAPSGAGVKHAWWSVRTSSESFSVDAALVDTKVTATRTVKVGPAEPVMLSVCALPATLPAAGKLVELTVTALIAGVPTENVPIGIETLPGGVVVMPTKFVTDVDGVGRATLLVPTNALEMRVEAVSGGTRSGITLAPAP